MGEGRGEPRSAGGVRSSGAPQDRAVPRQATSACPSVVRDVELHRLCLDKDQDALVQVDKVDLAERAAVVASEDAAAPGLQQRPRRRLAMGCL